MSNTETLTATALRLWVPNRVLLTKSARDLVNGREIARRAAQLGAEVIELKSDRLANVVDGGDPRADYVKAKSTLAVVVASAAKRRLQPIPPSADWRFDLAEGCPAHCQYCYLAGSLAGPPITRVYANLDEILSGLAAYLGQGAVTSRSARSSEGTTFECSCYTDPIAIEHLTGSLSRAVSFFGSWDADVQLRFTTKFGAVEPLIGLPHRGRTRVRMSVNAPALIRFDGGTDTLQARLHALKLLARVGYPVGLTVAPIQPVDSWQLQYEELFSMVAAELDDIPNLDLTAECITHRFTPKSKGVLQTWYPGSKLEMDETLRSRKLTKFGSMKHVYPAALMREMRAHISGVVAARLPYARLLYWT